MATLDGAAWLMDMNCVCSLRLSTALSLSTVTRGEDIAAREGEREAAAAVAAAGMSGPVAVV